MKLRKRLRSIVEKVALRLGWRLQRLTRRERRYFFPSHDNSSSIPQEALGTLVHDNPVLKDLQCRYSRVELPITEHSLWRHSVLESEVDLIHFRGDNPYVCQYRHIRSEADIRYYLYLRYVEERDTLGLLQRLTEDGAFGCWTFDYANRGPISRDLLDSVNEINFLERKLKLSGIPNLHVVDIGAGYGRLAFRMREALPNLSGYYCLDAIPESTFLCDYYLQYRNCIDRAKVVPLDIVQHWEPSGRLFLGVNIYSFPECPLEAIRWWIRWLARRRVQHLLIVPNDAEALLSTERDGTRLDFANLLGESGYRLMVREHIIDDPDVRYFTKIKSQFHLFHLEPEHSA